MAIIIPIIGIALEAFSIYMSLTSKPPIGGPKLADLQVTASTYGSPIKEGWGSFRLGGNIIWSGTLVEHKESGGGKGFGGPTEYQYTWTGAVGLLGTDQTGPITDILRIWADTKLVFDKTGATNGSDSQYGLPQQSGKGGSPHYSGQGPNGSWYNNVGDFTIYYGTEDQMPDPSMITLFGEGNCNANRGQAYIVFQNINLINYGNRVPNFTFEIAASGTSQNQLSQAITWNSDDTVVGGVSQYEVAIDPIRQLAYFFSTGSSPGIKVVDLTTRKEIRWATQSQIGDVNFSGTWLSPVVGLDGYLYCVSFTGSNSSPIVKIDPDALRVVGSFGVDGSGLSMKTTGFITCKTLLPMQIDGANFLVCVSALNGFNYVALLNADAMQPVYTAVDGSGDILAPLVNLNDIGVMDWTAGVQLSSSSVATYGVGHPNYGTPSSTGTTVYQLIVTASTFSLSTVGTIDPATVDSLWTEFTGASPPIIDQTDGNLLMFFEDTHDSISTPDHYHCYLVKVNASDASIMWRSATANPGSVIGTITGIPDTTNFYQYQIASGNIAWIDAGSNYQVFLVETQGGGMTYQRWDSITASGQVWADSVGAILFWGNLTNIVSDNWAVILVNAALADQIPLSEIVSDICAKVGLTGSQVNTTLLEGLTCEGYVLDQQYNAVDALRPLALAYTFDVTESDASLKFVPRGGASKVTIPQTDFSYMDKKLNTLIEEDRQQETDIPNQISVTFFDPDRDFQASVQYFRRPSQPFPTMYSKNPRTEQIPIVMQAVTAKQLAEKLLFSQWVNRVGYKAKLPWRYLPYDTTDPVTLTLPDGSTALARTVSINIGADLTIEYMGVAEQDQVYNPNSTAYSGSFPQNLMIPPGATRLFLMDMPLVRDQDDPGQSHNIMYYALGGYNSNWVGGSGLNSTNNSSFTLFGSQSPPGVSWGVLTNQLGDITEPAPFSLDTVNSMNVAMTIGGSNLATVSFLDMCNGSNAAAVINIATGDVEIVQFQTVTQEADGTYTLTNLARGRRGTEVFTGSHAAGDIFILLDPTTMGTIPMSLSQLDVPLFYEALSSGALPNSGTPFSFTSQFRALMPYAPVHIKATTSGSDIAISWLRRTRVSGAAASNGGQDRAPLSESEESYSVDIYDAMAENVLRTLNVTYTGSSPTSPGVTYTDAEYTADFGSKPASINMRVYQLSGVVGRGFSKLYNVVVDDPRGTP